MILLWHVIVYTAAMFLGVCFIGGISCHVLAHFMK
jgi:hypothetical protein